VFSYDRTNVCAVLFIYLFKASPQFCVFLLERLQLSKFLFNLRITGELVLCAADQSNQEVSDCGIFAIEIISLLDSVNCSDGHCAFVGQDLVRPFKVFLPFRTPLDET
jgi:hypothetical protein